MKTRDLFLMCACALAACSKKAPEKVPPAVRVEVVSSGTTASGAVQYSAVAQPDTTTPLAFRQPGYVIELMKVKTRDGQVREIGEGDRVRKGDVVARLRETEYREKVAQAQGQVAAAAAAAEKARLDFERDARLFATQSITRPQMEASTANRDGTKAQLAAAQAALEESRVALRDTALIAPVDAEVIKKSTEPGAFAGPGMPAFVIGEVSNVKVVVGLPDIAIRAVKLGQPVSVTSDALVGHTFAAHVTRIAAAADPVTRNFDVEIGIPNPERLWKPGMIASVELTGMSGQKPAPLLPLTAFVPAPAGGDHFGVMVVDAAGPSAHVKLRPVDLGDVVGNRVAVMNGLAAGERVVTTGAAMVVDGERVEVLPTEIP